MDGKKILILGGYGTVGSLVARLLLKESDVKLVLAGRNIDKAQATAEELNSGRGGRRVEGAYADAAEMESVKEAAKGAQCILMASTTVRYAHQVTRAALESKIDYMDVLYSPAKTALLIAMSLDIRNAGLCYVADCGIAPGLAAMLVRWAAPQFDALESARVGAALRMDWTEHQPVRETVRESLRVLNTYKHKVYKDGEWRSVSPLGMLTSMDFGEDLGRQNLAAMFIEEMRAATRAYPSIKEARFGMGGFNWFTTWVTFPVATAALWLSRGALLGPMGDFTMWSFTRFAKAPYGTVLKLEARGTKDGKAKAVDIILRHDDGYIFTAASVVSCVLQYLDGSIRKPGVWMEGMAVDPERTLRDLRRFGVSVEVREGTTGAVPAAD